MSKEIGIDALLIFFLISSEFGGNRRGFLLLLASEAGLHPKGLGSAIGIIAGTKILLSVSLLGWSGSSNPG